jgi:hypothetical protein
VRVQSGQEREECAESYREGERRDVVPEVHSAFVFFEFVHGLIGVGVCSSQLRRTKLDNTKERNLRRWCWSIVEIEKGVSVLNTKTLKEGQRKEIYAIPLRWLKTSTPTHPPSFAIRVLKNTSSFATFPSSPRPRHTSRTKRAVLARCRAASPTAHSERMASHSPKDFEEAELGPDGRIRVLRQQGSAALGCEGLGVWA